MFCAFFSSSCKSYTSALRGESKYKEKNHAVLLHTWYIILAPLGIMVFEMSTPLHKGKITSYKMPSTYITKILQALDKFLQRASVPWYLNGLNIIF